jgi:muramoyltetrapeptide carboxypeptidase
MSIGIMTQIGIPYLKPYDIVDIIAPAARCPQADLYKVQEWLSSWKLTGRVTEDLFGENLFSANTDDQRFQQLEQALTNPQSKAIWCLRGGYGSMKLLPRLAQINPPDQVKLFIGSSDITALHIFFQNKWGWPTIHGPGIHSAAIGKVNIESLNQLKELLFHPLNYFTLNDITPLNSSAEKYTKLACPVIGGNLSLIEASLGTCWQMDASHKIILIEEINERGYRIDRSLEHLKQAGIFNQATAILFGDILGGEEADGQSLAQKAVELFAQTCSIPVLQIHGVGHGMTNHPILLGYPALLTTGKAANLCFI